MAQSRIVIDSKIMMGKPVIKGTRITVEILLRKFAQNLSSQQILKDYPQLSEEDIKAAIEYAASTLQNEEIYTISQNQ